FSFQVTDHKCNVFGISSVSRCSVNDKLRKY
ncbi:MAG: hypothetical protein ACI9IJ_002148, partial [Psychromonas sp.]